MENLFAGIMGWWLHQKIGEKTYLKIMKFIQNAVVQTSSRVYTYALKRLENRQTRDWVGAMEKALLVLEDGSELQGLAFGARADRVFELVFNTAMTGYQEMISDPSYRGQGIMFTTSHIGNVGVNPADVESGVPQASAVVVRALSREVSNWRAASTLSDWLAGSDVPGISGVDTRWLTRKLRDLGSMKAALSTLGSSPARLREQLEAWPGLDGRDTVAEVTGSAPYAWAGDEGSAWVADHPRLHAHVVVFDFGVKRNILRHLAARLDRVTVVPAYTSFAEVMALNPDGVLLSNGPGDPAGLPGVVRVVGQLIESGLPILGICLGHQLIGRALGGETARLKFGHHSGNHPVRDLRSGKALVTSQNHNYTVLPGSLPQGEVDLTHISLNDGTLEGMRLRGRPVFSVQFHPEASPGPHDAFGLFTQFLSLISSPESGMEPSHAQA